MSLPEKQSCTVVLVFRESVFNSDAFVDALADFGICFKLFFQYFSSEITSFLNLALLQFSFNPAFVFGSIWPAFELFETLVINKIDRDTVGGGGLYECVSEALQKTLDCFLLILSLYDAY